MRTALAIIGGVVAGFAALVALAFIGGMIFPATVRMDAITAERVAAAFETLPLGAKLAVLFSWFGGALAGAAVAKLISGAAWTAWTVGGIFAIYVLATVFVLPMPAWMQVTAVVVPLLGALIANHLVGSRTISSPSETTAS